MDNLRLKNLRIEQKKSQYELAKIFNISQPTYATYENGTRQPPNETLIKIAEYFNVTTDYLLGRSENQITNDIEKAGGYYPNRNSFIKLRILGSVRAGVGGFAEEELIGYDLADKSEYKGLNEKEFFYLKVTGDSMFPDIQEDDIVLVKAQTSVDSGDIGVILIDDEEAVLKFIEYGKDWIKLISQNPDHETRIFKGIEVLRCRVIGKVISLKRKHFILRNK